MSKRYARNEFRYNYKTKHYNYIFEEDGKLLHGVGITHQKRTRLKNKWYKNMPLKQNPQQNKIEKSYIRSGYIAQNKNTFGKVDKRFAFRNDTDKANVKSKIRHFKNERRKR